MRKTILRTTIVTLCAVIAMVGVARAAPWTQTQKLMPRDGAEEDVFGIDVSVMGDWAVVGAYGDDENGAASGSAYVYKKSGGIWGFASKLVPADGHANQYFGNSVSICGDTVVVGAWGDDDNGVGAGAAYVYKETAGVWSLDTKLTATDGAPGDAFGRGVAVSGDTVVVGAWHDDDGGTSSGSAYVFKEAAGVWSQDAKLTASDGATGDEMGRAVAIDGSVVVVGAHGNDDSGSLSGSAYVYKDAGAGVWNEDTKLTAFDGATGDRFGFSVAVAGGLVAVGSYADDDKGGASGSVYVYDGSGAVWVLDAKLVASDGTNGDLFGFDVALDGSRLVAGAYGDDDSGSISGSAYVFDRSGTWSQEAKLLASDGAGGDQFGQAVAVCGDVALVGAYADSVNGHWSGSAYVFEPRQGGPVVPEPAGVGLIGMALFALRRRRS